MRINSALLAALVLACGIASAGEASAANGPTPRQALTVGKYLGKKLETWGKYLGRWVIESWAWDVVTEKAAEPDGADGMTPQGKTH